MSETIDCLFVFSYGVRETRGVMDGSPPSQVAVSRLLLVCFVVCVLFLFCFFSSPSFNGRVGQSARSQTGKNRHTNTHTPYIFFIEAVEGL